ncbi:MAG: nucleoside triphosphate pyrophosphohydrolase family protein [archaeon]|jgi:NTP pyrophosphatase (non-canonical NTP hydrolase)
MKLDEYQQKAKKTDLKTVIKESDLAYYALGLADEAGEVAGKVKKLYRDMNGELTDEYRKELAKEIGDVLWYASCLSARLGYKLSEVAEMNVEKLSSRKERKKLSGSGDNR